MLARCILLPVLTLFLALTAPGCSKVNEIGDPSGPDEQTQESRMRALQAPVPTPKGPPPPTMEEILAAFEVTEILVAFEVTPPEKRSDLQLARLSKFPSALSKFKELNLSHSMVTDTGGKLLGGFINLQSLVLANTRITNKTILAISTLPRLEQLDISGTRISDAGIQSLVLLKSLRELRVDGANLTDSGLARLGELPLLEALSASSCRGISGQQFTAAIMQGAYPRLRLLNVARTRFGTAGLLRIDLLDSLQHLNVTDCGVTDEGVKGIAACKELVILEAGENSFGQIGLAALSANRNLRELSIESNQSIKNDCLNSLKNLRELEKLNVSGTSVTEEAARLLKSKFLPQVTIQYNNKIL